MAKIVQKIQNKISIIILVFLSAGLVACGSLPSFDPEPETKRVVETRYPDLPPISIPDNPQIDPWQYDLPRDKDEVVVKEISSCMEVPESKRDDDFWKRCGKHPIIYDPEIRACLSPEEFKKMQIGFAQIEAYTKKLRNRLEEVNKQRKRWRQLNEESNGSNNSDSSE